MLFTLIAGTAMAQSIQGTATYRERMTLPPAAIFEAVLEDVSRADAAAEIIGRARIASPGNPPFAFTIPYDPAKILADHHYNVRARILVEEKPMFTTDTATPVITRGSPTKVSLLLRRVGATQVTPGSSAGMKPLEGTYWRAIELAGKPIPTLDLKREAYVQFERSRVSGSDTCNRITGNFELNNDRVSFGQIAATQMACPNPTGFEDPFRDALKRATRLTIAGDRLELFDQKGTRLAEFMAR